MCIRDREIEEYGNGSNEDKTSVTPDIGQSDNENAEDKIEINEGSSRNSLKDGRLKKTLSFRNDDETIEHSRSPTDNEGSNLSLRDDEGRKYSLSLRDEEGRQSNLSHSDDEPRKTNLSHTHHDRRKTQIFF